MEGRATPEVKVTWGEPPDEPRVTQVPYEDALNQVMGNPGQWASILEGESKAIHGRAQGLRKRAKEGRMPGQEEGEWEIKVRKIPTQDGKHGVWVMYKKKAS